VNDNFLKRRLGWIVAASLALAALALPTVGLQAESGLDDPEGSEPAAPHEHDGAHAEDSSARHEGEIHWHEEHEHQAHRHEDIDIIVDRDVARRNPLEWVSAFRDELEGEEDEVVVVRAGAPKVERRVVTRRAMEIRRKDADGNESVIRLDGDSLPEGPIGNDEIEAIRLASKYAKANDAEKKDIRRQLVQLTEKTFDDRVEKREKEIQEMRSELDEVADRLRERRSMRQQIIDRRVADLLDAPDALRWNMEPLPGGVSSRIDLPKDVNIFLRRADDSEHPVGHRIERREFLHPSPEAFINRFRRRDPGERSERQEDRARERDSEERGDPERDDPRDRTE